MKKVIFLFVFSMNSILFSQVDYSDSWEDFYSYNNVKDFVKVDNIIYALADNAVFTFDESTAEIQKFSSIQGLSGETTSAIYYNTDFDRLVIGYETGLIEVIDGNGVITISADIVNFNQSGNKRINHISGFGNTLYLSTPFAIVEYNIERLEFGDTFFIGNNSTSLSINQIKVFNGLIYAATEDGIFTADVGSNLLIDFNNWQQQFSGSNFQEIALLNNNLYTTQGSVLYRLDNNNLTEVRNFFQNINAIKSSNSNLSVALNNTAVILDVNMNEIIQFSINTEFDYQLNTSYFEDNTVFLGTTQFGILESTFGQPNDYKEIHPEGPLSNDVFSLTVKNNNLWLVYGGYNSTYTPVNRRQGYSRFDGSNWINTNFNSTLPNDLVHVNIDPNNEDRVYISALGVSSNINVTPTGGLLVVENDVVVEQYNHLNSSFEPIVVSLPSINIRVSSSAFDGLGNLWTTNYETSEELKKLSANGQWSSIDLSNIKTNPAPGLNDIIVDRNNTLWIGTRRNGVYVYNDNGARKKALIAVPNAGNLPELNVRAIAIDGSNRVWLGTGSGLVVYNNAFGVFDDNTPNANPIVINANQDGFGERLLGDQTVNSIVIDGADNKWFGTDNGGVIYTNPSGQTTLATFSKKNSPLPSNKIVKIAVDKTNGKVYFATNKGIVAYNSKVAPFGEVLGEVYAYPNPALKNHETVTIDGRNGTNLPQGTNVKILDVAGNLVYETNVVEGQELQGGRVVWNKKNLAGNKVASGIYIVLLSNEDSTETSTTKIAIVN